MELKTFTYFLDSPVGFLKITTDDTSLLSIDFVKSEGTSSERTPAILKETIQQLQEYFEGKRKEFRLNLNPAGTEFQKKTWEMVAMVPFGKTASYLDLAKQTGSEKNTRAVGTANGKNPIPIIIPCHRIIGTNGKLTGYAGGLYRKKWLLHHELTHSTHSNLLF